MRKYILGFTLIFLALLAADIYPGLRGGAGWQWPYELPESWMPVILLAATLAVYIAGVVALRRWAARVWSVLIWAVMGAAVIGVSVVSVRGDPAFLLFTRTVSPVQTGASTIAVNYFAAEGTIATLRRWPEVMRESLDSNLIHFTTSPPGQPLIHHAAARVFDRLPESVNQPLSMALRPFQCSDVNVMAYTRGELLSVGFVGMLMPLWAALAAVPVYFSARMLTGDRDSALRAVSWWPLIPAVLLFLPTWNTLYSLLCVTAFTLLLGGLRRRGVGFGGLCFAAGAVMSAATFLNFAVLPALLLLGLFTLGFWYFVLKRSGGFGWPLAAGVWFALGLSVFWLVLWLVSGHTPLDILAVTFDQHGQLVERDYVPWLLLHPYDVLMFAGWPLTALFAWGCWRAIKRGERTAGDVLALSMLVTLLVVNLSGVVQGENARILSFYAPFLLLGGVYLFSRSSRWDLPLLAAQAVTVLVMAAVLPVIPLDLNPQPGAPRTDVATLDMLDPLPVDATFTSENYAGAFRLEAQRFVADIGAQVITLETIWQGVGQVERPYSFEVIARAENDIDGEIVTAPFRWYAQNGNYLPTCWRPDDRVHDVVLIPLPVVSAPVVWSLELRAIDERTGDALRVTLDDGTISDYARLGPVNYP
jgi:hypothetical protein